MVLRGRPSWEPPADVTARRVSSLDELVAAREIQRQAFGDPRAVDRDRARRDLETEGVTGATFLAWVDGEPAAAAYSAYTTLGVILFGGATLPAARGRGAYRALVAARAAEAEQRGTPTLVTHAGQMSRPILERLGFEPVARIDRLIDRLAWRPRLRGEARQRGPTTRPRRLEVVQADAGDACVGGRIHECRQLVSRHAVGDPACGVDRRLGAGVVDRRSQRWPASGRRSRRWPRSRGTPSPCRPSGTNASTRPASGRPREARPDRRPALEHARRQRDRARQGCRPPRRAGGARD